MAKEKKLVEAITSMNEDFAQWYTDVVKKARRRLCTRGSLGYSRWTDRAARAYVCTSDL